MSKLISSDIVESINDSVLCWLATNSEDGFPNVSPKEAFLYDEEDRILIANIASPISVLNIQRDDRVCVGFVNVFVQRGFKVVGRARVLLPGDPGFEVQHAKLVEFIGTTFPIVSVIEITPTKIAAIVAPSYRLFPDSGPIDRIKESLRTYRVDEYQQRANHVE